MGATPRLSAVELEKEANAVDVGGGRQGYWGAEVIGLRGEAIWREGTYSHALDL